MRYIHSLRITGLSGIVGISVAVFIVDFCVGYVTVRNLIQAAIKSVLPLFICTVLYVLYSAFIGMFGPGDETIFIVLIMYAPIGLLAAALGAALRSQLNPLD